MNCFGEVLTAKLEDKNIAGVEDLLEMMDGDGPAHLTAPYLREQMRSRDASRVPDPQMIGAVARTLGLDEEEALDLLYVYIMDEEFPAS